jgi:ribosomal protein L32
MGQPKKQSSPRKTGLRRSHLRLNLARRVNGSSPVKATATRKETGKKVSLVAEFLAAVKTSPKPTVKPAAKTATKATVKKSAK